MANEIYNTTWWGNAIDTAITAGTEPDFFGSQMKMLTGQPELVTNGDFATDSDWTKGSAWTISGGTANFDGSTNSGLSQSKSFIAGKTYKVLFEITQGNASIAFLSSNGVTTYVNYATYGIGTHSVKFNYSTGSGFQIFGSSFLGGSFSIDNVSVKLARAEEVEAVKCLADWIHTTALQDLNN